MTYPEAVAAVREAFLENVKLHLRSDVPVGCALSGGIDSSAIVSAMRRVAGAETDIQSFGYVAQDPALDEQRWAELASRENGTRHRSVRVTDADLWRDLETVITTQDEPFSSTSVYAQYRVFRLAHENKIKVMLDGQGADELFAGYAPLVAARLATLWATLRVRQALELVRHLDLPRTGRLQTLAATGGYLVPTSWQRAFRKVSGRGLLQQGMNDEWFRRSEVNLQPFTYASRGASAFGSELWRSLTESVLPSLLRYEDRNSMAFSIESRVPFLTPRLAELASSLPEEFLVNGKGTTKAVFRDAMRGIVPQSILDRRDKIGFETPEAAWIRRSLPRIRNILDSEQAHAAAPIDLPEAARYLDGVLARRIPPDRRVWRWINLIEWSRIFRVKFG